MPRAKAKKDLYTIKITKTGLETIPGGITDEGLGEATRQVPDTKELVTREVYSQTVDNLDLKKVIEAINS